MSFGRFSPKRPSMAACACCYRAKPRGQQRDDGTPEKRCAPCIGAGCVPTYADYWQRGHDCPMTRRARHGGRASGASRKAKGDS